MDIVTIFCEIDDFCRSLLLARYPQLPGRSTSSSARANSLSLSEVMTILVWFHASHYRTFKHFYLGLVLPGKRGEFPGLPSYTRFVELIPLTLLPLCAYLPTRKGQPTAFNLSIVFLSGSVITAAFPRTKSLLDSHDGAKEAEAGSMASSCIW
jgi:hypothetical protein